MSNRRRRADDFTDSLISFRQTSSEEQNYTVSRTYSEDSLDIDYIKYGEFRDGKYNHLINKECGGGSVILAGNLVNTEFISLPDLYQTTKEDYNVAYNNKEFLLQDTLNNDTDGTSYLSIKSDLNKCINLFHNKHLSKERDIYDKYTSNSTALSKIKNIEELSHERKSIKVQCDLIRTSRAVSLNSLKHLDLSKQEIRKCKSCIMIDSNSRRDSNHNIKASQSVATVKKPPSINSHETVLSLFNELSLSKSFASLSKEIERHDIQLNEKNQRHVLTNDEKSIMEELDPKEFKSVLHSLKDPLKPLEETVTQEYLLKRLSATFYNSPRNFTERLLTIIEESVIDNNSCTSAVNLSRLTTELRKMCKFIEDETVPEWPPSPSSSPICSLKEKDEFNAALSKKINTNSILSTCDSLSTPSTPSRTYPRYNNSNKINHMPKSISINTISSPIYSSVMHDSTSTFECLEAHCKRVFPNESRNSPVQKDMLRPSLQNMNDILNMCKNQMASLENSPNPYEQFKNKSLTSIPSLESQHNAISKIPNFPFKSILHKTQNKKSISNNKKLKQYPGYEHCEITQINDLENTLIYEIAKKRQRCLDTAKVIMEIDAKSGPSGEQDVSYLNSLADNNNKLMQTLTSCKKYKNYLELLNLFQQVEPLNCPSPCNKKNVQIKNDIKKTDIATSEITKLPITIKKKDLNPSTKCLSVSEKTTVSKPRLFVTPGKAPSNKNNTKKRIYFPDLATSSSKQIAESNISPHAKSIYRHMGLNYNTVISPVGMYIKGTNPRLIKNSRLKINEIPLKKASKEYVEQNVHQKSKIKSQLSPQKYKEMLIKTTMKDKSISDQFTQKVDYKLQYSYDKKSGKHTHTSQSSK